MDPGPGPCQTRAQGQGSGTGPRGHHVSLFRPNLPFGTLRAAKADRSPPVLLAGRGGQHRGHCADQGTETESCSYLLGHSPPAWLPPPSPKRRLSGRRERPSPSHGHSSPQGTGTGNRHGVHSPRERVTRQTSTRDGRREGRTGSPTPTPICTRRSPDHGGPRGVSGSPSGRKPAACLSVAKRAEPGGRAQLTAHDPPQLEDLGLGVGAGGAAHVRLWGPRPRGAVGRVLSPLCRKGPGLASARPACGRWQDHT